MMRRKTRAPGGKTSQRNFNQEEQAKLRMAFLSSILRGISKVANFAPRSSSTRLVLHLSFSGTTLYFIFCFTFVLVSASKGVSQSSEMFLRFRPYFVLRSLLESLARNCTLGLEQERLMLWKLMNLEQSMTLGCKDFEMDSIK